VIRTTGSTVGATATSRPVFDLVAFLLGYREEVFREILRNAVDTLLAPGRSAANKGHAPTKRPSQEVGRHNDSQRPEDERSEDKSH
jgi:hypothetical protein